MFSNSASAGEVLQSSYVDGMTATVTDQGTAQAKTCLYGIIAENNDAANDAYLQFFDAQASAVTLGTTAPTWTVKIPKGGSVFLEPKRALKYFDAGLSVACTTTRIGLTAMTTKPTVTLFFSQR